MGNKIASKMPMMPITTNSSTSENAGRAGSRRDRGLRDGGLRFIVQSQTAGRPDQGARPTARKEVTT